MKDQIAEKMRLLKFIKSKILILIGILLLGSNINAQQIESISQNGILNFGTFVNSSGGTLTLDPVSSGTIRNNDPGGIILVRSIGSTVQFTVTKKGNDTGNGQGNGTGTLKALSVSANPTVLTNIGPGTGSLELTSEFVQPRINFPDGSNSLTIYMGGTLNVGPEDTPGRYEGQVTVYFDIVNQ